MSKKKRTLSWLDERDEKGIFADQSSWFGNEETCLRIRRNLEVAAVSVF